MAAVHAHPNLLNRRGPHAMLFRHGAAAPMRGAFRLAMQGIVDDRFNLGPADLWFAPEILVEVEADACIDC